MSFYERDDTAVNCLRLIDKYTPASARPYNITERVDLAVLRKAGFDISRRVPEQRPKWQRPGRRPAEIMSRGRKAALEYLAQIGPQQKSQGYYGRKFGVSQVTVSQSVRRLRTERASAVNAGSSKIGYYPSPLQGRGHPNYGRAASVAKKYLSAPRQRGELIRMAAEAGLSMSSLSVAVRRQRAMNGRAA